MNKRLSEMTLEELWGLFPIILKEHDPEYPAWYKEQKQSIESIVPKEVIKRISHIGSSAVTGLVSKPTVDILLELSRDFDIGKLKQSLKGGGWVLMSESNEPYMNMSFNKGYTPLGFAEKVFHLHVRYFGDWDELYFRDYLLEHKQTAKEYGELKLSLHEKYRNDRDGYTNAKTEFIKKYTEKARRKFGGRYTKD